MKNTLLWSILFALTGTQIQAEPAKTASPQTAPTPAAAAAAPASPANQPAPSQTSAQPQSTQTINCEYKIPAGTKTIEQSLILSWSKQAVIQSFDFDPLHLEDQLKKLKSCFTEPGWSGFSSALEKSGNINAIKSQKLTVSSQLDGEAQLTNNQNNQWYISLPLHVVYQNDKEKVTQLLNVSLIVGRKINGDLGIIQMIATPRTTAATSSSSNPAASGTNKTSPPVSNNNPGSKTPPKTSN